jgi:glycoside/pentoside/hexuronide:cation symporter, GPH family
MTGPTAQVAGTRRIAAAAPPPAALPRGALLAYGSFGVPLAMASLPLYVQVPQLYGAHFGLDLAWIGALLLALRALDALADPWLGAWSDRFSDRFVPIAWAAPALAFGMVALLAPVVRGETALMLWLAASLVVVYAAFSLATINHGAWGAELSRDPVERTRITATREALALGGVIAASVLPAVLSPDTAQGLSRFALVVAAVTAVTVLALRRAPRTRRTAIDPRPVWTRVGVPLADPAFRRLLAVYVPNGVAAAIPATLLPFYVADVLDATSRQGLFLALYFVAGAAGMPLWVRAAATIGSVRAWMASMALAAVAFVGATTLGPGDAAAFALICAASGLALGADLALPPALLAGIAGRGSGADTGSYFGAWTFATKLNLALAAGVALPLLSALGYVPGTDSPGALASVAFVYAGLPCALKLVAMAALARYDHPTPRSTP